jgi:hypothetical protein
MSVPRPGMTVWGSILALALVVAACSKNPLAPFQPEINSATDNFQLQATGVTGRTASLDYNWQNSGTRAKVNHSTATTYGTARLTIRDATDAVVYDSMLVPSRSDTTGTGVTGLWHIQLTLVGYSGTLNFRVQKL